MTAHKVRRSKQEIQALIDEDVKGRVGGFARAKKLSAARRKEIAQQAAITRWSKPK